MVIGTMGVRFYENYEFPVCFTEDIKKLEEKDAEKFYKILYLKGGKGNFSINGITKKLSGSYLVCLNEKDVINPEQLKVLHGRKKLLFFKPQVFNENLDFLVCNEKKEPKGLDKQDIFYFRRFRWDMEWERKLIPLNETESMMIERELQGIEEYLTKQETADWPCLCRTNVLEILFYLAKLGAWEDETKKEDCSRLTKEVIHYLQLHYSEKITLDMICGQFGTNRTTLCDEFKKATGMRISQYLQQMRLQIAATLLKDTDIPIHEVGERTGFYDNSHFCRLFKRENSYTPSDYRRCYGNISDGV